jgi:hypothetical protein
MVTGTKFGYGAARCLSCAVIVDNSDGTSHTWEGKTLAEICVQIKDPARNGGRKVEDLVHHIGTDTLVGWAWSPGFGRTPAPGTQKEAGALVDAWIKTGAVCPAQ